MKYKRTRHQMACSGAHSHKAQLEYKLVRPKLKRQGLRPTWINLGPQTETIAHDIHFKDQKWSQPVFIFISGLKTGGGRLVVQDVDGAAEVLRDDALGGQKLVGFVLADQREWRGVKHAYHHRLNHEDRGWRCLPWRHFVLLP